MVERNAGQSGGRSAGRSPAARLAARLAGAIAAAALLVLASGCLYPREMRQENRMAVADSILVVQNAVDQYKAKTGVLPIRNADVDTPIFEKYAIDLKKLTEGPYLGQIPGVAFEKGGSFRFLLIDAETDPKVKLLDLVAYQTTGEVQKAVDDYRKANGGAVPKGEPVGPGVYRLDFAKLNKKPEQIKSVFSGQYAGFLIDDAGTVAIDYALDIMQALKRRGIVAENGAGSLPPDLADADLRKILVEDAPFVPVKSFPYRWIEGEPKASAS
jgi:hypothetical protein